jgi:hypothetical protein
LRVRAGVRRTGAKCFLYTILCQSPVTQKGVPLVWMITNSERQEPIITWLTWLRDNHGFAPSSVMIDNSDTEIAAIREVYGEPPHEVTVFLCHWHVLKAWRKNVWAKVSFTTKKAKSIGTWLIFFVGENPS